MLKARVITAIFLLAGLLCALFLLPSWGWLAFVSVICATAAHEWGGIVGYKGARRWIYAVLLGALCFSFGLVAGLHRDDTVAPFNLVPAYGLSALFWVLCVPFWLRSRWALPGAGAAALVGFVLLIPPSLAMIHLRLLSPWLLLGVMASVWIADIAAYFTGRAFGRRKLAPAISPGKSWEGAYGAVAGVVIYGLVCLSYFLPHGLAIGQLVFVNGTAKTNLSNGDVVPRSTTKLFTPSVTGRAGEEITIDINAEDVISLAGMQMSLELDRNLAELIDIHSTSLKFNNENLGFGNLSDGLIHISWNDNTAISVKEKVITVKVKLLKDVEDAQILSIQKAGLLPEFYVLEGNDVQTSSLKLITNYREKSSIEKFELYQNIRGHHGLDGAGTRAWYYYYCGCNHLLLARPSYQHY